MKGNFRHFVRNFVIGRTKVFDVFTILISVESQHLFEGRVVYMWSESMGAKGQKLGGLKRHTAAGRHHTNMFVSVVVVFYCFSSPFTVEDQSSTSSAMEDDSFVNYSGVGGSPF